jgi:hypothetical protein
MADLEAKCRRLWKSLTRAKARTLDLEFGGIHLLLKNS